MKKTIIFIGVLAIGILLLISLELGDVIMPKQSFVYENSLLGVSIDEVRCQWNSIDHIDSAGRTSINLLQPWYTRWKRDTEYLVTVFRNDVITDYLIFDSDNHLIKGSVSPTLSLKNTLSQIAANNKLHITRDVGSGVSINTAFTCDGYIVAWTSDKETMIYDAQTFRQKNVYFIYRLIHGMLW